MEIKNKLFKKVALNEVNVKGKLLSRSLLWMGLGLFVIILVAFLSSSISSFNSIMLQISFGTPWLILTFVNIGLIFAMFFSIRNFQTSIYISAILYVIFSFIQGIYVSSILFLTNLQNLSNLLLLMLIPAGIFVIMGIIAFSNIIDFTKLLPFTFFAFIGLLVMSIILIFVQSDVGQRWFLFLAAALFIIWIGIDLQMIKRTEDAFSISNEVMDNSTMNRLAFMFGFQLFLDFVNLLLILIRLIGLSRN